MDKYFRLVDLMKHTKGWLVSKTRYAGAEPTTVNRMMLQYLERYEIGPDIALAPWILTKIKNAPLTCLRGI